MLQKKEKGQGLLEFALILPFLLLALLGVVESARIIWGYITVQTAAREAARYAITGKPYVSSGYTGPFCLSPDGQPGETGPWNCQPVDRVEAIKEIAKIRLNTMPLKSPCSWSEIASSADCTLKPGNYGILVSGQIISPTYSITTPYEQNNNPGTQGLNVKVSVFYNIEMFDPIFDALVDRMTPGPYGGYIKLKGELVMQNEGVDPALGNDPPPPINGSNVITDSGATGIGPNGERISAASGYNVLQNENLTVYLENHQPQGGPYNIYLGAYRLFCPPPIVDLNTTTQNTGLYDCLVDPNIPPGSYELLSTVKDQYPNRLATAPELVVVGATNVRSILINDPQTHLPANIWSPNSSVELQLVAHEPAKQFNVYLNFGLPSQQIIASNVAGNATLPLWTVPNVGSICLPLPNATPCKIESRWTGALGTTYASADLFITQPQLVIVGGETKFAQGEPIYIQLTGHTPNKKYDIQIRETTTSGNNLYLGATGVTDSQGNTTAPLIWTVLMPGADPGWPAGWPNGTFNISSHPAATPPSMTPANLVASKQIQIVTPNGPFVTVDGGYTWPANSNIIIRVHQHSPAFNPYYLKFGPSRVPVTGSTPANTFNVGASQDAAVNYVIPLTAAAGSVTNYTIASYSSTTQIVAQHAFTVTSVPVITVLEGPRVLPDATITISLTRHVPNSVFQIIYAGVALVEDSGQPFTIQTGSNGQGQRTYSLLKLPAASPAANAANYGIPYPLNSRQTIAPNALVATTTLTIDSADLKITQIQLPATAAINTSIPMTVTIQNTKPVTVARYFDVDFYADPAPLVPTYLANQFNFPGDAKQWKAPSVAPYGQPGDTFSMVQPFTVTAYGTHTFYSYADTSNLIYNENNEVNNILSNTINIICNYSFITDTFTTSPLSSAWATPKIFNTGNTSNASGYPRVDTSTGRLQMRNDGKSTGGTDDNSGSRGQVYLYRTQSLSTELGLDVRVQIFAAPTTADYAKAGLELRSGLGGTSSKLEFNLAYDTGNSKYRLQYSYRPTGGSTNSFNSTNGSLTVNSSNPIWLRIKRDPNTNNFTFYYAQQLAAPTQAQWQVFSTLTFALETQLYIGLFNASYLDGTNAQTDFDNFSFGNTASCPVPQNLPAEPVPPGLTFCTNPLVNTSFETTGIWGVANSEGVVFGSGGHTGNQQLLADTFSGTYRKPYFYQQFQMPASLLATTTLKLDLFYTLNNLNDGDDANDKYYAIVATSPSPSATLVTSPTLIANGDVPPDTSSAPINTTYGWVQKTVSLPLANGVNLSSYVGSTLYLYLYNNSNTTTASCLFPGCHKTKYSFDDVNLSICTSQPEPATAATKLTGDVVLHRPGISPEKIAGVTVWTYAENGTLYKTFSIQNGQFNFYDLPATPTGTTYFIYAEYYFTDPSDPNQIETLTANTKVLLKTTNTVQNPLRTRLDLFPID